MNTEVGTKLLQALINFLRRKSVKMSKTVGSATPKIPLRDFKSSTIYIFQNSKILKWDLRFQNHRIQSIYLCWDIRYTKLCNTKSLIAGLAETLQWIMEMYRQDFKISWDLRFINFFKIYWLLSIQHCWCAQEKKKSYRYRCIMKMNHNQDRWWIVVMSSILELFLKRNF